MSNPLLIDVIDGLRHTKWPAEVFDREWRLLWVSNELKAAVGNDDDEQLGVGSHIHSSRSRPTWSTFITDDSKRTWVRSVMATTPGGKDAVVQLAPDDLREAFEAVDAAEPPSVWSWEFQLADEERDVPSVAGLGQTLRDDHGIAGFLFVYAPALPSNLLKPLVSGDQGMFSRMARLAAPQPAEAAILLADLEASAALSRRLPSSAFFSFICALSTAIDDAVIARQGIVGKHAGDGTIAFFLAEDLGGPASAAAAAVDVARAVPAAVRGAAREVEGLLEEGEDAVNVGVHWGPASSRRHEAAPSSRRRGCSSASTRPSRASSRSTATTFATPPWPSSPVPTPRPSETPVRSPSSTCVHRGAMNERVVATDESGGASPS